MHPVCDRHLAESVTSLQSVITFWLKEQIRPLSLMDFWAREMRELLFL